MTLGRPGGPARRTGRTGCAAGCASVRRPRPWRRAGLVAALLFFLAATPIEPSASTIRVLKHTRFRFVGIEIGGWDHDRPRIVNLTWLGPLPPGLGPRP